MYAPLVTHFVESGHIETKKPSYNVIDETNSINVHGSILDI